MKIVFLTANSTWVNFIVRELDERLGLEQLVHICIPPTTLSFWEKLRRFRKAPITQNVEQRFFYRRLHQQQDGQATRLLGAPALPARLGSGLDVLLTELNGPETAARLRALEPDVLVVCSAPLLKPEIFTIPKLATLNVHFGIAPLYRGDNTIFWPLFYRDYRNVGVTIHRITAGIDSGPIVAQGRVQMDPADNLVTLHAKSVRLATELLVETIGRGQADVLRGEPQAVKGRLFPYRARRIWHDAWYYLRTTLGGERPPKLEETRYVARCATALEDVRSS